MNKPLVSIVLPTYNGSRYLENSIQSCLGQTYWNWELIIIDDASTDSTLEIAEKYVAIDERIQYFRHETNKKLPGALNTGFGKAKGEYLTWTSDDNMFRPNALGEMVAFLQESPDVGLVYADFTVIDEEGKEHERVDLLEPENLAYINCVGACFLYRREVFKAIGNYSEDLFLAEDYDYWLRISQNFKIRWYKKDLYLYRRHEASLSMQKQKLVNLAAEKTLVRNLPKMNWVSRIMRAKGYLRLLEIAKANEDDVKTKKYWFNAFLMSPSYILTLERKKASRRMNHKFKYELVPSIYNFLNTHIPAVTKLYKKVKSFVKTKKN